MFTSALSLNRRSLALGSSSRYSSISRLSMVFCPLTNNIVYSYSLAPPCALNQDNFHNRISRFFTYPQRHIFLHKIRGARRVCLRGLSPSRARKPLVRGFLYPFLR